MRRDAHMRELAGEKCRLKAARKSEREETYRCGPLFVTGGRFDGPVLRLLRVVGARAENMPSKFHRPGRDSGLRNVPSDGDVPVGWSCTRSGRGSTTPTFRAISVQAKK
jgi:hypothetical protein